MTARQIAGIALIIFALAGTQLPKINLNSGGPETVPVAPVAPEGRQPVVLKIAESWPPPTKARTVCRQGLCAARQGALITIGPRPKVAKQRLQRVQRQLTAGDRAGAQR